VTWLVVILLVQVAWLLLVAPRVQRDRDARQRRIGWGYGYGAGWYDGKKGRYEPGAPVDGRTRMVGL
jgi:hypothetical protein